MTREKSKRKQDIVFLNVLFCMLVIFIHCSSEIITQMDHGRTAYQAVRILSRLSGFVVQGFLLLSGVKLFLKPEVHYGRFYLSRLFYVVLPYMFWVTVYYLYFCYRGVLVFAWYDLGQYLLWGNLSAQFYFVVLIVQFYILAPLWRLIYRRVSPTALLLVTLMISGICSSGLTDIAKLLLPDWEIAHLDVSFLRYLFYWTAGCVIGMHYQEFQRALRRHWLGLTILYLLTAFFNAGVAALASSELPLWLTDQIHMLYCISAILFFYMLAQLLTDGGRITLKPLSMLDRATYDIYLVHCLVIFIANEWMYRMKITDLMTRYAYRALIAYAGSILLCLLWQAVKRRTGRLMAKS